MTSDILSVFGPVCRYLGPGYWITVAPLSREIYREYSRQYPAHSDPAFIFQSKHMIQWFMSGEKSRKSDEANGADRAAESDEGDDERLRIVYRGVAGACLSETEGYQLIWWVKQVYEFVPDTETYCLMIRKLPSQSFNIRMLYFLHRRLESDLPASRLQIDCNEIFKTLWLTPALGHTWQSRRMIVIWLLEVMRFKHPDHPDSEAYVRYLKGEQQTI